jgi:hypothetical protein
MRVKAAEGEMWFERYLDDRGIGWERERDLGVAPGRTI